MAKTIGGALLINRFDRVFASTKAVLPVVHVRNAVQVLECVQLAEKAEADGVWLIEHHHRPTEFLKQIYREVRINFPSLWVGVNFLGVPPLRVISEYLEGDMNGIWIDNLGVDTQGNTAPGEKVVAAIKGSGYPGLLFAGVAFKYQDPVKDEDLPGLTATAGEILREVGVVTTSGVATARSPDLRKVATMCEAARRQGCPLAIASGMTAENIREYVPYVDAFLVGTYLEDPGTGLFVPSRLQSLLAAVRGC